MTLCSDSDCEWRLWCKEHIPTPFPTIEIEKCKYYEKVIDNERKKQLRIIS